MPLIPPATIDILGDNSDLLAKIAESKAALADFAKTYTAHLTADATGIGTAVANANSQLAGFAKTYTAQLQASAADVATGIAAANAQLGKYSTQAPHNALLGADGKPIAASITAADARLSKWAGKTYNVHLGAEDDVTAKITAINKELANWARKTWETHLGAEADYLKALAAAKTALTKYGNTLYNAKLGLNDQPALEQFAAVKKILNGYSPDWNANLDTAAATAKLKAWEAWADSQTATIHLNADTSGLTSAAITRALGSSGGDKSSGAGTSALLTALAALVGIGKSGTASHFGITLPKAGTLLSIAGLSIDHAIITTLALAGTATAGLIGALVKGFASAGVLAIGAGSSALVGSSTIADTSAMYKLLAANPALSYQSVTTMTKLPRDAGTQAEFANAQALVALNNYWDTATSTGRAAASKLYASFFQVAQTFIPKINAAATKNFEIITKDIQPLIQWIDSMGTVKNPGGLRIFQQLETQYAKQLPTAITAFTNAFEGLAKVVAYVAPTTGKFLKSMASFFTAFNESISGQKNTTGKFQNLNVKSTINNLLADWQAVYSFIKSVISAAYNLFSQGKDQHTGRAIFTELTGFLNQLIAFEKSAQGTADISNVFAVHKAEILAILQVLPPLFKALGGLYITVAPAAVKVATTAITAIVAGLNVLVGALAGVAKIPDIGKTIVGIGGLLTIMAVRSGALKTGLNGATAAIGDLLTKVGGKAGGALGTVLGKLGGLLGGGKTSFPAAVGEFGGFVKQFGEIVGKASLGGKGGGLGGAAAGGAATTAEEDAGAKAAALALLTKIGGSAGLALVAADIATAWLDKNIPIAKLDFLLHNPNPQPPRGSPASKSLHTLAEAAAALLNKAGGNRPGTWKTLATSALQKDISTLQQFEGGSAPGASQVIAALKEQLHLDLTKDGKSAGDSMKAGLNQSLNDHSTTNKAATSMMTDLTKHAKSAVGASSPATVYITLGQNIDQGLLKGLKADQHLILDWAKALTTQLLTYEHGQLPNWRMVGESIGTTINDGLSKEKGLLVKTTKDASQAMLAALTAQLPAYRHMGSEISQAIAQGVQDSEAALANTIATTVTLAVSTAVQKATQQAVLQAQAQTVTSVRAGAGRLY